MDMGGCKTTLVFLCSFEIGLRGAVRHTKEKEGEA